MPIFKVMCIYNKKQEGAVLVVSLLLLLVMTLIAVGGISISLLEENMVANSENHSLVFQGAESAIEGTIRDESVLLESLNLQDGNPFPSRTFELNHASSSQVITAVTTVEALPPSPALGFSLGQFVSYPFEIKSQSAIANSGALSTHVQVIKRVAPRLE